MKWQKQVRGAVAILALASVVAAAGCNGNAAPLTAEEQKNFSAPPKQPDNVGQMMKDQAAQFHGRPSGGQQMGNGGPGGPPAGAVPTGPPPGAGAGGAR